MEREPKAETMEERLCYAAMKGDLASLQEVIAMDDSILDRVVVGIFKGKNPLHVAISIGQTQFVFELLRIKPGLAELLDPELGAPLHIASAKGHFEIVEALMKVSPKMCLARDRNGYNPLHVAAIEGQIRVLELLTGLYPDRARVKVDQDEGETILHLCVKYHQFSCLKQLVELIPDPDFVNDVDSGGNTLLHLAVSQRRAEMIQLLLGGDRTVRCLLDVNATNKRGRTALDICNQLGGLAQSETILLDAGAKMGKEVLVKDEPEWLSKRRDTFMIVASLIATMAFQVGVNPPGGVWQDTTAEHVAGEAVLAYTKPNEFRVLMMENTVGFFLSLSSIALLIFTLREPKGEYSTFRATITLGPIIFISFSYIYSLLGIIPVKRYYWLILTGKVTYLLWVIVMTTSMFSVPIIRRNRPWERVLRR